MQIGKLNTQADIFIIAEIGNNHEGDFQVACDMLKAAAQTGVDAVKFQSIVPEKLVSSDQTDRIKQLKRFELSRSQYESLARLSQDEGIYFMSTPFDIDTIDFLDDLVPAFKIASGDNNFYPLLAKAASKAKPVIMSTGMANIEDTKRSIAAMTDVWHNAGLKEQDLLSILHCVSNYPTQPEDANIAAVKTLSDTFGLTTGYSDHTIGTEAAVLSVAYGARIIEKHFTLDNDFSDFRDHKISADPKAMKTLVDQVRNANKMLGSGQKQPGAGEQTMKGGARRSIAAGRDLRAGTVITLDDLTWLRPGTGIQLGDEDRVVGKKVTKEIKAGLLITTDSIQ